MTDKTPYKVLTSGSIELPFVMALIADRRGYPELRDECLAQVAQIAEQRRLAEPPQDAEPVLPWCDWCNCYHSANARHIAKYPQ